MKISDYAEPAVSVYVAVCTLELSLVTMVMQGLDSESIIRGLTHKVARIYALDRVVEKDRTDNFNILEPFITRGNKSTLRAFQSAIWYNYRDLIPYLSDKHIEKGIHQACLINKPDVTHFIFPQIPDRPRIEACSRNVQLAVSCGGVNLLRVLITSGARLNDIMIMGGDQGDDHTVLHWLDVWGMRNNDCHRAVRPKVRMLCDAGADVNAVDSDRKTPLHHFAETGAATIKPTERFEDNFTNERIDYVYERVIRCLIDAGADIDAQDYQGEHRYT